MGDALSFFEAQIDSTVLGPEGRYIGTFAPEETTLPGAFGPAGLVAFVETDEYDVATIVVKRLLEAVR